MKIFRSIGRDFEIRTKKLWILHSVHYDTSIGKSLDDIILSKCTCSYCKGYSKLKYGLNLPKNRNGWKVIKYWHNRYLKWI